MDVSRIEAYNPNKINWRGMTAKEILKYEKQGVQVPDVYVQWAREFLQNIARYDNDEVTYERAKSTTRHQSNEAKTNENTRGNENVKVRNLDKADEKEEENKESDIVAEQANIPSMDANSENASTENGTEAIQMTAAQTKHKDMQDKGVKLRDQAISFTQDSKETEKEAVTETRTVDELKSDSDNETAELESQIQELVSEAEAKQNELKQEVDKINNNKNDDNSFAKIDKLQKELERAGISGQNSIIESEATLRGLATEIEAGQGAMLNAADFGTETIDVGNELLSTTGNNWWFIIDRIIGQNAVNAGSSAVDKARVGEDTVDSATNANNANLRKIPELKNTVESKTGVDARDSKQQGNSTEQDPITGKEKESDKDIKTASNDGTDTTDKLNISIDELVKRKARRGEYAKES